MRIRQSLCTAEILLTSKGLGSMRIRQQVEREEAERPVTKKRKRSPEKSEEREKPKKLRKLNQE